MKRLFAVAIATTLISGAAFAQNPLQAPATTAPAKPIFPWQQKAQPAAPAQTMPAQTAPMRPVAPAAAPTTVAPGQDAKGAGAARKTQCSQEYQANKEAIKAQYGSWPKFYSACNTRIKTTGR